MEQYDKISKINIPVDDFIWRNPSKLSAKDYKIYINAYENHPTSGNIFAYFNYDKIRMNVISYEDFIKNGKKTIYNQNIENTFIANIPKQLNLL